MTIIARLSPPSAALSPRSLLASSPRHPDAWTSLQRRLKSNAGVTCLFSSNNRKEEEARKALEGALGGKKDEFERWSREIEKRQQTGGSDGGGTAAGGGGGGGGWFGWGRWFGWFGGGHFWIEALRVILTLLGIVLLYLIVAKGELMLAIFFNPLLHALRNIRTGFSYAASKASGRSSSHSTVSPSTKKDDYRFLSAKERVVSKWGT